MASFSSDSFSTSAFSELAFDFAAAALTADDYIIFCRRKGRR